MRNRPRIKRYRIRSSHLEVFRNLYSKCLDSFYKGPKKSKPLWILSSRNLRPPRPPWETWGRACTKSQQGAASEATTPAARLTCATTKWGFVQFWLSHGSRSQWDKSSRWRRRHCSGVIMCKINKSANINVYGYEFVNYPLQYTI